MLSCRQSTGLVEELSFLLSRWFFSVFTARRKAAVSWLAAWRNERHQVYSTVPPRLAKKYTAAGFLCISSLAPSPHQTPAFSSSPFPFFFRFIWRRLIQNRAALQRLLYVSRRIIGVGVLKCLWFSYGACQGTKFVASVEGLFLPQPPLPLLVAMQGSKQKKWFCHLFHFIYIFRLRRRRLDVYYWVRWWRREWLCNWWRASDAR